jgi:uncharacterized protein
MLLFAELLVAGLASGFLAGLLGIGGGFVVVPVLMLLLPSFGLGHEIVPQVAVATSLAAMVPTAISAVLTQHRRGFLDRSIIAQLAPGAVLGALVGSQLAKVVGGVWVALFFMLYAGYFAWKMLNDSAAAPPQRGLARAIAALPMPCVAAAIGALSAVAGVGGASMTVPYLLARGVDMRRCVAVSSATGLAIAVAGAGSFAGATVTTDQASLVGLVCWPAALTLAVSAILMAPRGVAASHRLPVPKLKRAFGGVLIAVCVTTLMKLIAPHPSLPTDDLFAAAPRPAAKSPSAAIQENL